MKFNTTWGYGQLFGFSAYDGPNRFKDDHILITMNDPLTFRYEFNKHYVLLKFINKKSNIQYSSIMSDFVIAKINGFDFKLTFLDNDTLIGVSPLLPTFIGEINLKNVSNIYQIDNHYLTLKYVKLNKGYKFIIRHSLNLKDAKKNIDELLKISSVDQIIKDRIKFYVDAGKCKDKKYESLYYKCLSVNKVNTHTKEGDIKYFWTTPDRVPHKKMWLWDSAFHALMMVNFNKDKAEESMLAMLSQIKKNGFLPHMASPVEYSDVTQPCVLSWVSYKMYEKTHNKEYLKNVVDYLDKYLTYDIKYRDENKDGLLEWLTDPNDKNCKCGESGLDNSSRFDFDEKMNCIDFSTYFALDTKYLSLIYKVLNSKSKYEYWNRISKNTINKINSCMYSYKDGVYYDQLFSGKLTHILTSASFLPLFVGIVDKKNVKKMVKLLFDKNHLYTKFPFASLSRCDKEFSNDMWRGGVWININYFMIVGLLKYGYKKEAESIRKITLDTINKWYKKTGCIFEFYDPNDKVAPYYCLRKGKALKKPDYRKHVHSITDYHWSAAFTYLMIQGIF